jgi:hypothetical protein
MRTLARAWHLGAVERSEAAPFIELIFGRQHELRLAELEAGIPGLNLSGAEREYFRGRIAQDVRGAHAPGVAALAELMVGVRLTNAGAAVGFVEVGRKRGVRTPDIEASRGDAKVTLELTSFHAGDSARAAADADHAAFMSWRPGSPVPEGLRGRVSARPGIKIMESSRQRLGPDVLPAQIYGLARKLRDKADHGQLSGRPNPVLVVNCWHMWGLNAADFDRSDPLAPNSAYWAALYGKKGEVVTDGVEFEGGSLRTWTLGSDGVLVAPGDAAALLWLFQSGQPLLAMRAAASSPVLDTEAQRLLLDAFDPVVMAPE